jgi:hypothetical protein
MIKRITIALFLISQVFQVKAQLEVYPIFVEATTNSKPNSRLVARVQALDTLQLPFIEDFVSLKTTTLWEKNSGAYLNNHFATRAPNLGTATLDGIDGTGTPYVFIPNKTTAAGVGDYLVSKPIDLSNTSDQDGVALSFFWQQGTQHDKNRDPLWSKGEQLKIYFKDTLNEYKLVWPNLAIVNKIAALYKSRDTFYLENIVVPKQFLHKGFQMKFEYFGTLVGNYGVFSIDNIWLDKGIANFGADTTFKEPKDYAFNTLPTPLLANYTSMPTKHFLASPETILSPSITATMQTLDNLFITDIDSSLKITHLPSNATLLKSPSNSFDFHFFARAENYPVNWDIATASLKTSIDQALSTKETNILTTTVKVLTPDSISRTDVSQNQTVLADYYAYEDGSMEAGLGVRKVGEFVQAYDFLLEDTLAGFYVYFPKYGLNLSDVFITYNIYSSLKDVDGGTENTKILTINGIVEYSKDSISLNKFIYIPFSKLLPVAKKRYYFGIAQNSDNRILLGLDYSKNRADDIHYRLYEGTWSSFSSNNGYGTMALRPRMASDSAKAAFDANPPINAAAKKLILEAYPNPASSLLHFNFVLDQVKLYNLQKKELLTSQNTDQLELTSLETGFYLIEMELNGTTQQAKIQINSY